MKAITYLLALIFCLVAQLQGASIEGKRYKFFNSGGGSHSYSRSSGSGKTLQQRKEALKKGFQGVKEVGKILFGGGGEAILKKVINKHAVFCKKMGLIFKESNSPIDTHTIIIPRIWVYYYINNIDLNRDDLYRIYISAYEELDRLINENEGLKPYLEEEKYTRKDGRLILGFDCVDESYVMQETPNLSYIARNKNDQIQLFYNRYGVIYGVSGCVTESEHKEVGDYNDIKKRLGL